MKTQKALALRILAETLDDYEPELGQEEIDRFQKIHPLREAIRIAARSRKENGHPYKHQQKNWNCHEDGKGIKTAMRILPAESDRFNACADFDEIHELVKELLAGIGGLGPVYYYDVAFRIGAKLGYLPDKTYLHAGPLKGAQYLGLPTVKGFLDRSDLPDLLKRFEPWQVEDILCHFAKQFKRATQLVH